MCFFRFLDYSSGFFIEKYVFLFEFESNGIEFVSELEGLEWGLEGLVFLLLVFVGLK